MSRFYSLEGKFLKNSDLHAQYLAFYKISSNHMELITNKNSCSVNSNYYLIHHCVDKTESSATKLRVVFNTFAKMSNYYSMIDPKPKYLVRVLLKFHLNCVFFCSDIWQMFQMILLSEHPCNYQRSL